MTLPILILPCWLYHPTQGGKIFRTREEIEEAKAQGWRDSPGAAAAAEGIVNSEEVDSESTIHYPLSTASEALPEIFVPSAEQPVWGPIISPAIAEVQKVIRKPRKR